MKLPVAGKNVVLGSTEARLQRIVFEAADDSILHLSPCEWVEAASCDMVNGSAVGRHTAYVR